MVSHPREVNCPAPRRSRASQTARIRGVQGPGKLAAPGSALPIFGQRPKSGAWIEPCTLASAPGTHRWGVVVSPWMGGLDRWQIGKADDAFSRSEFFDRANVAWLKLAKGG